LFTFFVEVLNCPASILVLEQTMIYSKHHRQSTQNQRKKNQLVKISAPPWTPHLTDKHLATTANSTINPHQG